LPPDSPSHKRDRDENDSASKPSGTFFEETGILNEPRQIAGSRRVASKYPSTSPLGGPPLPQDYPGPSTLPMNIEELGHPTFDTYGIPGIGEQAHSSGQFSAEPMVDAGGPFDTGHTHGLMDDAFYGQMAMLFGTPFGEMTSDQVAAAYCGGPQFQTVSDDGYWGPLLGDPRLVDSSLVPSRRISAVICRYSWDYSG
jgi:hypothetical protein